jgi:hypothetical protein
MYALIERLQAVFAATAFAEVGEWKPAVEIAGARAVPLRERAAIARAYEAAFVAAAFAEANCPEIAKETLDAALEKKRGFLDAVRLAGVKTRWMAVPVAQPSFLETVGLIGVRARTGIVRMGAGAFA